MVRRGSRDGVFTLPNGRVLTEPVDSRDKRQRELAQVQKDVREKLRKAREIKERLEDARTR